MVGPETMIMDMPKIVSLLNGMFSMVKYGLSRCYGGFGTDGSASGPVLSNSCSASMTRWDRISTLLTSFIRVGDADNSTHEKLSNNRRILWIKTWPVHC